MSPGPTSGPSWAGRLLVATPVLTEPNFARAVVAVLQHTDEDGALGVVVNRPSELVLGDVLPAWHDLAAEPAVVFTGGPVQPQAAICLGRSRPGAPRSGSFAGLAGTGLLGTVDLDADPDELRPALELLRVFAGYAGWAAGQLEAEVQEGAWWVLDALPGDAFAPRPELLWGQVLRRQGPPLAFAACYPVDPTLN